MRTVTETFEVYKYSELSDKAKEKVNQWYLNDPFRDTELSEAYIGDLQYLFPNSDLKIQYSLTHCQGDGLNIYGTLNLCDVFGVIEDHSDRWEVFQNFLDRMTEHEQEIIEEYTKVCGGSVTLPYNDSRYNYCISNRIDFAREWIVELRYRQYKEIQVDTICKMESLVADLFTVLAKTYEECGYRYFMRQMR